MADSPQADEAVARYRAEHRLAVVSRVAAEAMRMLTDEQIAELRRRLDVLEAGDGRSDG